MSRDRFHIMIERDVGLFSLIQQVVSQIPWALKKSRIPVVYFGANCSYWTESGHRGKDTVWEYYFEPLYADFPASAVPTELFHNVEWERRPRPFQLIDGGSIASAHFGDHPTLSGLTLKIPYEWLDPSTRLRRATSRIFQQYIKPRDYMRDRVDSFLSKFLAEPFIGVHARGTDALHDRRDFRKDSLVFENYFNAINHHSKSACKIYVATDEDAIIQQFRSVFGKRIVALDTVRHIGGVAKGKGPTGGLMPAYIAGDRAIAARNGEEAVAEWLILRRAKHLIHNGSSLARSALLAEPDLSHSNVHLGTVRRSRLIAIYLDHYKREMIHRFQRRIAGE